MKKRLYYFDHLRALMILFVIILHASLAYTSIVPQIVKWYIPDQGHFFFDGICFFVNLFVMPTLFLIAGYFTYPSWKKRGSVLFLRDKFFHIMLPFFLGSILLNAYPNFIAAKLSGLYTGSYWHYYIFDYLKMIPTLLYPSKASAQLWFLVLLFVFYALFVFIKGLIEKIPSLNYKAFLIIGLLSSIFFFLSNVFLPKELIQVNFWIIQRMHLPLYFLFFLLGILFFKHKNRFRFSYIPIWVISTLFLISADLFLHMYCLSYLIEYLSLRALYALIHCFATLCTVTSFVALFERFCNRYSRLLENIASNGYAIFILHFNFVIFLGYIFRYLTFPLLLKWALVIVLTSIVSYAISERILKKIPWINRMLY